VTIITSFPHLKFISVITLYLVHVNKLFHFMLLIKIQLLILCFSSASLDTEITCAEAFALKIVYRPTYFLLENRVENFSLGIM
jgi:hypothetical protein